MFIIIHFHILGIGFAYDASTLGGLKSLLFSVSVKFSFSAFVNLYPKIESQIESVTPLKLITKYGISK